MKKFLALAGALTLASCVAGSPAYAEHKDSYEHRQHDQREHADDRDHHKGGFSVRIVTQQPYVYDYPNYRYNYDNRYRNDQYMTYRYFSRLPSYYPGRCGYNTVVVQDPYTQRYVCMPRLDYERYRYEIRNRY